MNSTMLLVVLFLCCLALGKSDFDTSSVNISVPKFVNSVNSAIHFVERAISIVSGFNKKGLNDLRSESLSDFRLKNAVTDCIELMESSVDQLTSTIYAIENRPGNSKEPNGTGSLSADLKTWLSAALMNQETCKDGLTNATNNSFLNVTLDKITSLVLHILSNITTTTATTTTNFLNPKPHHPPDPNLPAKRVLADAVVATDGTGNFTTITEAINAAPNRSTTRYVIHVKGGTYKDEYVVIGSEKWNIMMVGDDMNSTVISGNRSVVDGWTTFRSATFAVKGRGFIASDMTFENTAGPEKHQAVAFRSDSDLSVLYRCAFKGYQDTLYAHTIIQFYKHCFIIGTVDFIFGDGCVVFQNCTLLARKGLPNQKNTITAQGRKEPVASTGFSIQFCNISVEQNVLINSTIETFLGRPWKAYSRTVIMQSYISDAISPLGWLEWDGNVSLDTLWYGEYLNIGPGASLEKRVTWPGYHVLNTTDEVNKFTVSEFLFGDAWLPSTGVNYTAGLTG